MYVPWVCWDYACSVLKFQRNRTKPEKHEHDISRLFGQKKLELLTGRWTLNGNIFFELFLGNLDENMSFVGYKRERNKQRETVR